MGIPLITPLGEVEISLDGIKIDYEYRKIELDKSCRNVNGRYGIWICFQPDGREHNISCTIKGYEESERDEIEPGESLELKSFFCNNVKLSIGMVGDSGYISGERISEFDYDNEYLKNGVEYVLLDITRCNRFVFGISWIENVSEDNAIQTWFGADPTLESYKNLLTIK